MTLSVVSNYGLILQTFIVEVWKAKCASISENLPQSGRASWTKERFGGIILLPDVCMTARVARLAGR
jgi:hypothetical protein